MTELDDHFYAIGLKAVLALPDAKLLAAANHVDNFTLAVAQPISHAIIDAVDTDKDDHCAWFNAHVANGAIRCQSRRSNSYYPSNNSLCRKIAAEAYKQLNGTT